MREGLPRCMQARHHAACTLTACKCGDAAWLVEAARTMQASLTLMRQEEQTRAVAGPGQGANKQNASKATGESKQNMTMRHTHVYTAHHNTVSNAGLSLLFAAPDGSLNHWVKQDDWISVCKFVHRGMRR